MSAREKNVENRYHDDNLVKLTCLLDETYTMAGLDGEWLMIAAYVGLFIVAIRGQ